MTIEPNDYDPRVKEVSDEVGFEANYWSLDLVSKIWSTMIVETTVGPRQFLKVQEQHTIFSLSARY